MMPSKVGQIEKLVKMASKAEDLEGERKVESEGL